MCELLEAPARAHAAALPPTVSLDAIRTGRDLIAGLAAACEWGPPA